MGDEKRFLEAIDILHAVGYEHISYQIYPRMRHEVLNEKEKERRQQQLKLRWGCLSERVRVRVRLLCTRGHQAWVRARAWGTCGDQTSRASVS